ncbi:MAG: insulinase family protein [candidate division WOR-3 bacterium]|nr:insulinase family protein [candidate division WOR-3 bacterium]
MEKTSVKNPVIIKDIGPNTKIVAETLNQYYSFALGLFITYGSRDEKKEDNGITHLIEHMLFKGTSRRSALEIVQMIEGLGGSFDAYTTKESLVIVTRFLSEHLIKVFDLIREILFESKFGSEEFLKEKSVIMEEIKTNNEDPADYVYDLLFEAVFKDHPMGMPVAGTIESVSGLNLEKVHAHYSHLLNYPMVISVSGNFNLDDLTSFAQKKFGGGTIKPLSRVAPDVYQPRHLFQSRKDITQVHLCFGIPSVSYPSHLRHHILLLSTMLGGGMSSRLFQGLREEKGLVYDVHSFVDFYSDCGIIGFYLNADKKNLSEIIKQLKTIYNGLYSRGFSSEEIEIAKTYITGNLLMGLENTTNRMLRLGREFCYLHKITPIEESVKNINSITKEELNELARNYFDLKKYSIAAVGPIDEKLLQTFIEDLRG